MRHIIDSISLYDDLGIVVTSDDSLLDHLEIKGIETQDYPDQHGEDVDLSQARFSARVITLNCAVAINSPVELAQRINALMQLLDPATLHRLQVVHDDGLSLHYDVYLSAGFKVQKKWRDGKSIASWSLVLREPRPVKKIFVCNSTVAELRVESTTPLQIGLGDGTYINHAYTQDIEHEYTDNIDYHYVIVAGLVADATITTDMIEL